MVANFLDYFSSYIVATTDNINIPMNGIGLVIDDNMRKKASISEI